MEIIAIEYLHHQLLYLYITETKYNIEPGIKMAIRIMANEVLMQDPLVLEPLLQSLPIKL